MVYTYEYPRPAVAVDLVVIRERPPSSSLLLIQRKNEPFQGCWALPGGFIEMDETVEESAARELREETGLVAISLSQIGVFSTVDRDPRGRVISVGFRATVASEMEPVASDDADAAAWFALDDLPPLAFDHDLMIRRALNL